MSTLEERQSLCSAGRQGNEDYDHHIPAGLSLVPIQVPPSFPSLAGYEAKMALTLWTQ